MEKGECVFHRNFAIRNSLVLYSRNMGQGILGWCHRLINLRSCSICPSFLISRSAVQVCSPVPIESIIIRSRRCSDDSGCRKFRLYLKPRHSLRIICEGIRKELQGNFAAQIEILGEKDFSHASLFDLPPGDSSVRKHPADLRHAVLQAEVG